MTSSGFLSKIFLQLLQFARSLQSDEHIQILLFEKKLYEGDCCCLNLPLHKENEKFLQYHQQRSIIMNSTSMRLAILGFSLLPCFLVTAAYSPSPIGGRREMLQGLLAGAVSTTLLVPDEVKAVISPKYCSYGVGDGCEDLAEGNELIRQLQAKSAANKESIQRVRFDIDFLHGLWMAVVCVGWLFLENGRAFTISAMVSPKSLFLCLFVCFLYLTFDCSLAS